MSRFQADPRDLELDALLNRIRARHGLRPRDAEDVRQFSAGYNAGAIAAYDEIDAHVAEELRLVAEGVARAFRLENPALVRWRDRVLKHPRRYPKADVAAAYELLALEASLGGETEIAARARSQARRAMGVSDIKNSEAEAVA